MIPLPLIISGGIGLLALVIVVPILLRRQAGRKMAEFFLFDREKGVTNGHGANLADLVIHSRGGYVLRPNTTINVRYGRAMFERGPVAWRRRVRPVSLIYVGFSAPIRITDSGGLDIDPLNKDEFNTRERMAAEIAVSEAAVRAGAADFVAKVMAGSIAVLALPVAGIAVLIAMRG